jgi:hypothetical protein
MRTISQHRRRPAALLFTLVLLLHCGSFACHAQRLTGRVMTVDGIAVTSATVRLVPSSDTTQAFVTRTDDSGRFEFLLTSRDGAPVAQDLRLEQNYPNPFSSATVFSYVLPASGPAALDLFDCMGRHVRTLFSGEQAAGTHYVSWDGRGDAATQLPAGAYLAVLRTDRASLARISVLGAAAPVAHSAPTASHRALAKTEQSFTPAIDYRIDVLDTIIALPRIQSKSMPLSIGQSDTTVTIVVDYGGWEDLEFPAPVVKRLFVDGAYLYACARKFGLWRKNVVVNSAWEYLGLGDSNVRVGVQDVDARGDTIMVAFDGRTNTAFHPDSVVSLWRTTDAGKQWSKYDSSIHTLLQGLPSFPNVINALSLIKRSPNRCNSLIALISIATGILRSDDDGKTWSLLRGNADPTIGESNGWWDTNRSGVFYVQYVTQGKGRISGYDRYGDTVLYTINQAFDDMTCIAEDTAHIYATFGFLYYSADTGRTWAVLHDSLWGVQMLALHPTQSSVIASMYNKSLLMIVPAKRNWYQFTKTPWQISSNIVVCPRKNSIYYIANSRIYTMSLP